MSILVLSAEEKIKSLRIKRDEIDSMIEYYTKQISTEKQNDPENTINGQVKEDI